MVKEYGGEEDEAPWPHRPQKNIMEKILMQGEMEGKRRTGRQATTWFQDLKEWSKLLWTKLAIIHVASLLAKCTYCCRYGRRPDSRASCTDTCTTRWYWCMSPVFFVAIVQLLRALVDVYDTQSALLYI